MRIGELHWDDDERNVNHLMQAHQVTVDEVYEIVDGVDGDDPRYYIRRSGAGYIVLGETGGGRLLQLYGKLREDGKFRIFGARDMSPGEKRAFRRRM